MRLKESQDIEFKQSWHDDYLKTISAFANTNGGKLYVGIADDGCACGITNAKKLLEDLPNKIMNSTGVHAGVHIIIENELEIIEIEVNKTSYPISYHGRFYTRNGSTTQEVKGNALQQLILTSNNLTWDEIPISNASWSDIDSGAVKSFVRKAIQNNRLPTDIDETDTQQLFENLGLYKDGVLTRAAMLLFARKPIQYCFLAVCKIGRFRGSSNTDLITDDVVECPLFLMPDKIMELLQSKYLQRTFSYAGLQRIETLEYPEIALREAILNAVIHRDYGGNTFFTIKVFDNVLELWNEGELMPPLSIDKLKQQHVSRLRNKLIANVFYRSGQVESWGRGTLKMIENARNSGFSEPIFSESDGGVLVSFKNINVTPPITPLITPPITPLITPPITELEGKILGIIENNATITAQKLAVELNIGIDTVKEYIENLKNKNVLQRIGNNRTGYWKITST
ncbi:ATP-dependent DNA helicase [Bacteroidia bacterium]|nr:ATP-dependent DNA helicase [Bacteroidia bacterium]